MFNRNDIQRIVTASFGAAILSATCVMGAVSPAKAADLDTAHWQQSVDQQIDRTMEMPTLRHPLDGHIVATVAVRFNEKGGFEGANVAKSSGDAAADAEALRTASAVRYPALPANAPRTVTMRLVFADSEKEVQLASREPVTTAPVQVASR